MGGVRGGSLDAARTGPRMRHGNVKAGGIRGMVEM